MTQSATPRTTSLETDPLIQAEEFDDTSRAGGDAISSHLVVSVFTQIVAL